MRLLGRLVNQMRLETGKGEITLTQCIEPKEMFDKVIESTRKLCKISPGKKGKAAIPSTALKIGHELKHATNLLHNLSVRQGDPEMKRRAKDFRYLHETEWGQKISKHSLTTLAANKRHQTLPFTEDLQVCNIINYR